MRSERRSEVGLSRLGGEKFLALEKARKEPSDRRAPVFRQVNLIQEECLGRQVSLLEAVLQERQKVVEWNASLLRDA